MLGVDVDAVVVATQGGYADAVLTDQRGDLGLALHRGALLLGVGVHVRPVDGHCGLALREGEVDFFLGCAGGGGGDGLVLVGVHESLQALLGLLIGDGDVAVLVHDGPAPAAHEAVGHDGQALVLLQGRGQAVLVLDLLALLDERVPVLRDVLDDVGVAVQQLRVGVLRQRVELVVVGCGLHGRLQQLAGVDLEVALQRCEPAVGCELCGPDDVQCHDVDVVLACLQGLHQGVALGVGLTGELLELHLLVRVLLVPRIDDRAELVGVVLAHREGDGAAGVGALLALGGVVGAAVGAGCQSHAGCREDGQHLLVLVCHSGAFLGGTPG